MKTITTAAIGVVVALAVIGLYMFSAQPTNTSVTSSASDQSKSHVTGPSGTTGGTAPMTIYLTDAPAKNQTLKYLLVNVSSVELRYTGNLNASTSSSSSTSTSTTTSSATSATLSTSSTWTGSSTASASPENTFIFNVPANVGRNVNLTSLHGQGLLLGATQVPAGNITGIVINISGAKAFFTDGASEQLKVVADGKLMVPIHFSVQTSGSNNLTIDITPNLLHISQGRVLTPVIHVTSTETKRDGTTVTNTTDVDEASSTTTSTTT